MDTCAAEFESSTAYMYSTYEDECEAFVSDKRKIMVLGGGPNRIGQGIEFDYCCVHASLGLREEGYETIMVNCNPETVSTDFDTSDRLYGGREQAESPECMPACSICWSIPPITTLSPSHTASMSISIAWFKKPSKSTGLLALA